ncbi:Uncharacterised protein [Candidatus Burarchaeum australiense]|nr:Uncharacterised protein [Candidatus Burarchaeum australiense]
MEGVFWSPSYEVTLPGFSVSQSADEGGGEGAKSV